MSQTHWKGVTLPTGGDDLLRAWSAAFDTAGVIFTASSRAQASQKLDAAYAAGYRPTVSNPAYVLVAGVLYFVQAKAGGAWIYSAVNETEYRHFTYGNPSWQATLSQGQESAMITGTLPARDYARLVTSTASVWVQSLDSGNLDIKVRGHGVTRAARAASNTDANLTIQHVCKVSPGQTATVSVLVVGGQGGGKGHLDWSAEWTGLDMVAQPIASVA